MNPKIGSISILLPEPRISELIIQDETSTEYEYPDIDIDAEQWRRISAYVEEQVRLQVIDDGILKKTEENTKQVLKRLLQELGWKYVTFRQ